MAPCSRASILHLFDGLVRSPASDSHRQLLQVSSLLFFSDFFSSKFILTSFCLTRYLIAKRAATAEFEANQAKLASNSWAATAEYASLQGALAAKGQTLYDLEAKLVADIASGKFQ